MRRRVQRIQFHWWYAAIDTNGPAFGIRCAGMRVSRVSNMEKK